MNPSTALATVLVDELVRHRVQDVVLAPGSRSAPLAYALYDADRAGRLRLHVRIDERSAGFVALGLAKAAGWPVAVVTTSGTAVANLHPAVLEASHAGVPLVVLSADRPAELRGTGANQTTDQVKIFGDAVRMFHDVAAPDRRVGQVAYWRALVSRAVVAARGDLTSDPGPVQLNVSLREPLVPEPSAVWVEPLDGRADGEPWLVASSPQPWLGTTLPRLDDVERTLVVVGDAPLLVGLAAAELAERRGWPLVAEPSSHSRRADTVDVGPLVLGAAAWVDENLPTRVLVVGRPTLSRTVGALLRRPGVRVEVVTTGPRWSDPALAAARVLDPAVLWAADEDSPVSAMYEDSMYRDSMYREGWLAAGKRARAAVDAVLDSSASLSGPTVARELFATAPRDSLFVLGSSNAIRDVDIAAVPDAGQRYVLANRGLAGIDGTVSTAIGAALEHHRSTGRPAFALMGDLTFLHDANGLVLGPYERRPDLTIVVVNDDGGGIFTLLEQGSPELSESFDRLFGTPHGVDLAALCAATGTPYVRVNAVEALREELGTVGGLRVIEVPLERSRHRALHIELQAAVSVALT